MLVLNKKAEYNHLKNNSNKIMWDTLIFNECLPVFHGLKFFLEIIGAHILDLGTLHFYFIDVRHDLSGGELALAKFLLLLIEKAIGPK